jgi:hypothetical protein
MLNDLFTLEKRYKGTIEFNGRNIFHLLLSGNGGSNGVETRYSHIYVS